MASLPGSDSYTISQDVRNTLNSLGPVGIIGAHFGEDRANSTIDPA